MTKFDADVVIAGGGMVGMTLAVALGSAGMRVLVLDKEPLATQLEEAFDGRVSAVALASKHLFSALGVWEGLAQAAQPILDIRVSDDAAPVFVHYDHREVGSDPFGYIVENRWIRKALADRAAQLDNLEVLAPAWITSYQTDAAGVTATLNSKRKLHARLLIAAEGKQSPLRAMANIPVIEAKYPHTAIVCTIAHTQPHQGLAQERFLPVGPFAVLPMTENRSSLVWTEPHELVPAMLSLNGTALVEQITRRVGNYLGKITLAGPRFTYPLNFVHAERYTADRLALIGDAAHAIHPIAGQGVNLGFRDVAALAELLVDAYRIGGDIGSPALLNQYERWRRFDALTMLAVTDGLNRLFSNAFPPLQLVRRAGLALINQITPAKRFFMRHAMGVVGTLPRLLKGETL